MPKLFDFQAESMPSWWDGNYQMPWSKENLELIAQDGASQVVIVPTVYMDSLTSTKVYRDNNDPGGISVGTETYPGTDDLINFEGSRTESDASIRVAIERAKALGLEIIFKLHVNIQNEDWNALIGPPKKNADGTPLTEPQKKAWADAWFASYKEAVVHYAKLAQEHGATAFAIGNECESMTGSQYREYWVDIIEAVREVYDGQLTYAATWTEALNVSFWDKLDYMGANPYISFTQDNKNPSLQQLIDGWTKPSEIWGVKTPIEDRFGENISAIDALKRIAEQYGKKLIFTEVGFRSLDGSNATPWMWGNGDIDELEQLNMHKAFYKIITDRVDEGWLGGYWHWNYDAGMDVSDPAPDDGFNTHGKRADALIEQYFKDPRSIVGRSLSGTAADDTITGGFNHDTLAGGAGNDLLRGGAGADIFIYAGGDGADIISDFNFGQGDKIALMNTGTLTFADLQISTTTGGYVVSFAAGGSLTILTSETLSADWFAFNGTGQPGPSTRPSSGDDHVTGTTKGNTIDALEGNDVIDGLAGNDKLTGNAGDDTIDGGLGNDALYGGVGEDFIDGGTGTDRIYGSAGYDILYGGAGNDQIRGEDDDDMLYGDVGNDLIRGGNGADFIDGGEGTDKLYGDAGNDRIDGGKGNDLIQGGSGADRIDGDDGDDKIYGGNGNDVLDGWFGKDQIWGGAGNDVLGAGAGNDKLWGGTGSDRFVFNEGTGSDIVYDFKVKQNEMLLIRHNINQTGIVDFDTLKPHMKQVGKNVVMELGKYEWVEGPDVLTIVNVQLKDLKEEHFYFYW
jgi:Ca2+-binding RTX toxin-like protein